ncbi:hypothetical protein J3R83DRAFT_10608 [Lanmaoa asiatica]|nr:hypothetical protein J3R83DRAFT_10608 [Lanmaoa asiatica]
MDEYRPMPSPYALPSAYVSSMSATSSLSGAVGELDIPPQLRNPTPHHSFHPYRASPMHQRQTSAQSDLAYSHPLIHAPSPRPYVNHSTPSPSHRDSMEDEIKILRRKVRELELVNDHSRLRIKELESELARGSPTESTMNHSKNSPLTSLPTQNTPNPSSIHMSWKSRTDARIRLFCSLNRAGNALCSWHDSRRERRAYPPRMAPPGCLNCGCTYEEALFEESLSRHGVGSYHPGETVRMDPALRNPLLRLLQQRYGYRDGDFERDPVTGEWVEGEGPSLWEQKLAAGTLSVRKARNEDRR